MVPPEGYPSSSEAIAEPESAWLMPGNRAGQVAIEVELTAAEHERTARRVDCGYRGNRRRTSRNAFR